MKWVLRLFGVLVVLLIAAGVIGYLYIETVVIQEAEKIATRELGVPVNLGTMTIGWMDKTVTVRGIKVSNPDGFKTPYFVKVPKIAVQMSDKILSDPLVVDSVSIDGLTAYYEVGDKGNNLKKIQNNMLKSSRSKSMSKDGNASKSKEFVIRDLRISNSVLVPALSVAGQDVQQSVAIPLIHLRNIGSERNPATSKEVILQVMTALTGKIQNSALPKLITNRVADEAIKQIDKAKDAIGGAIDGLFGK